MVQVSVIEKGPCSFGCSSPCSFPGRVWHPPVPFLPPCSFFTIGQSDFGSNPEILPKEALAPWWAAKWVWLGGACFCGSGCRTTAATDPTPWGHFKKCPSRTAALRQRRVPSSTARSQLHHEVVPSSERSELDRRSPPVRSHPCAPRCCRRVPASRTHVRAGSAAPHLTCGSVRRRLTPNSVRTAHLEHARGRGLAAVAAWTRRMAAPPHRVSHHDLGRAWEAASTPRAHCG